jgi:hypothetical protein
VKPVGQVRLDLQHRQGSQKACHSRGAKLPPDRIRQVIRSIKSIAGHSLSAPFVTDQTLPASECSRIAQPARGSRQNTVKFDLIFRRRPQVSFPPAALARGASRHGRCSLPLLIFGCRSSICGTTSKIAGITERHERPRKRRTRA